MNAATAPQCPLEAKASLGFGILSWLLLGPLAGVPAIICGHRARAKINKSQGTLRGSGIALAGLITGYSGSAIYLALCGIYFAIFNLGDVFRGAQQAAAQTNLQAMRSALLSYKANVGSYPTTEQGLRALVERPVSVRGWRVVMERLGADPWGRDFQYRSPGVRYPDSFDVFSFGPDGVESADDIYPP